MQTAACLYDPLTILHLHMAVCHYDHECDTIDYNGYHIAQYLAASVVICLNCKQNI